MGEFEYLPIVCPVVLIGYVGFLFLLYRYLHPVQERYFPHIPEGKFLSTISTSSLSLASSLSSSPISQGVFPSISVSLSSSPLSFSNSQKQKNGSQGTGIAWNYVLFLTRLSSAIYYWVFLMMILTVGYYPSNFNYFTNWNVLLILIYFTLTSCLSFYSLFFSSCFCSCCCSNSEEEEINENNHLSPQLQARLQLKSRSKHSLQSQSLLHQFLEKLSLLMILFYFMMSPTALFITLVDFILLDSSLTYRNISGHLINTICIIIELYSNVIPIKMRDIGIFLSWPTLYTIVIWIVRSEGAVRKWPYDFLSMSSPGSIGWYIGMMLGMVLFFSIFYFFSTIKFRYLIGMSNHSFSSSDPLSRDTKYAPLLHDEEQTDQDSQRLRDDSIRIIT